MHNEYKSRLVKWKTRNCVDVYEFLLWSRPTSLTDGDARCVGEFRTTFRTIPAPVAQGIEQRFPKPQVACSIHAGGAVEVPAKQKISHVLQVLSAINGYSEITDNVRLCPTFRGARAGQN